MCGQAAAAVFCIQHALPQPQTPNIGDLISKKAVPKKSGNRFRPLSMEDESFWESVSAEHEMQNHEKELVSVPTAALQHMDLDDFPKLSGGDVQVQVVQVKVRSLETQASGLRSEDTTVCILPPLFSPDVPTTRCLSTMSSFCFAPGV